MPLLQSLTSWRFRPVLDLNHLLLFIATLSPVVVLARTWRRAALNRSWRLAAVAVLAVTAAAFMIAPRHAGFIGGGAWLFLLLIPAVGLRKAAEFASEGRVPRARRIVSWLRFLHPVRAVREEHVLLQGLELAQRGESQIAAGILANLARNKTRAGRRALAQNLRIRGDWEGLLEWCRQNIPRVGLGEDPALLPLYFRTLGELGLRDELVIQFAGRAPSLLASPLHQSSFLTGLTLVLSFCGRTRTLLRLLQTSRRRLPPDAKEFWIATSEAAAGHVESSRARLERLRETSADAVIRADAAERLERPGPYALSPLNPPSEATVRRFEKSVELKRGLLLATRSGWPTPAVFFFIALNVAFFAAEIAFGGTTNPIALQRLGALEPSAVLGAGQYWRLFTALFLHYGALHLLVNLYALYLLGPSLEASIGTMRFAFCYLVSGFGSSAGVVALWRLGLTQSDLLVGASGAVMGIVGAWAGLLLGHRHVPMAQRRLISIALIVGIQTAFDLSTPQVSMAAHLCGFISGLIVGLVIAPKDKKAL